MYNNIISYIYRIIHTNNYIILYRAEYIVYLQLYQLLLGMQWISNNYPVYLTSLVGLLQSDRIVKRLFSII